MKDQELYKRLLIRDDTAFRYVYTANHSKIINLIRQHKVSSEDAEEIYHDCILIMWMNIKKGKLLNDASLNISSYLYGICRNLILAKIRKNKRILTTELVDSGVSAEPEAALEHQRSAEMLIEHCLSELSAACQQVLHMFYFEKRTMNFIAKKLNITDASAKNKKYRCMSALHRICMEKKSKNEP